MHKAKMQNVKMVNFSAKRGFKTKFTFFASFLIFTVSNGSAFPKRPSFGSDSRLAWLPNDSEDEIEFRRLPSDRKPFYDDPSELEGERHSQMTQALDNVLQNEDEIPADELLMAMSKRNPTSEDSRTYKNLLGYYLVELPGHNIMGTNSVAECNKHGIFVSGRDKGIPFIKNQDSGWFLAINDAGQVYMTANKSTDTAIRSMFRDNITPRVLLYRNISGPVQKQYFLHIKPSGRVVTEQQAADTSTFKVKLGKICS